MMREADALIRIQEIDLALMRYNRTLNAMPQAEKIKNIRAARKALAKEMKKVIGQRKDAEMDLEENESSQTRLQAREIELRERGNATELSFREVQDLEAELTSLAKTLEKRQYKHKDLVDRLEKVRQTEAKALETDRMLVNQEQLELESIKEQTADIRRDAAALKAEREEVVKSISDEVMAEYEAATKRFGGLGVEILRGNMPSICSVKVSPSAFGDIKLGPEITTCPYCHRLLVTTYMFEEPKKD